MLIDCSTCRVRDTGCADCLMTVLLDPSGPVAGLTAEESRAIEVLTRGGFDVEVLTTGSDPKAATRPAPRPVPLAGRRRDRRLRIA
jgi:hypothetical protein